MHTLDIVPGVHRLARGSTACYVVETDDGAALSNVRPCTGHDPWCRQRVPCQQSRWTPDQASAGTSGEGSGMPRRLVADARIHSADEAHRAALSRKARSTSAVERTP